MKVCLNVSRLLGVGCDIEPLLILNVDFEVWSYLVNRYG